jgi:hypothetical protein
LLQALANGDQLIIANALFKPRSIGIGMRQQHISSHDETGGVTRGALQRESGEAA